MTARGGAELDGVRLAALDRLLEMSTRLGDLAQRSGFAAIGELAEHVASNACVLAGMTDVGAQQEPDRLVVVVELVRVTDKLWDGHGQLLKEKVAVHYADGPSRQVALASTLVLMARALLDQITTEGHITAELCLSCDLEEAMEEYEQALGPSAVELAEIEQRRSEKQKEREARATTEAGALCEPSIHGSGRVD